MLVTVAGEAVKARPRGTDAERPGGTLHLACVWESGPWVRASVCSFSIAVKGRHGNTFALSQGARRGTLPSVRFSRTAARLLPRVLPSGCR